MATFHSYLTFAVLLLVLHFVLFVKRLNAQYTCDNVDDYYPCTCQQINLDDRNVITCDQVETQVAMGVFNRTQTIELSEINIYKKAGDRLIPDNMIADKRARKLFLYCSYIPGEKIEKNAFNSTRHYTTIVELENCLLQDSDLSFIEGFTNMGSLSINHFLDMGKLFSTFPTNLPTISNIKFIECYGWNTLVNAPSPIVGANNFDRLDVVMSVDMTDDVMDVVMEWAVQSFSLSLKKLYIHTNNLTRIPPQIEFFDRIETLDIEKNVIRIIPSNSFKFKSNYLELIDLSYCGVQIIEPNAFQGKFDGIFIDLSGNSLTRLDSSVFEEILLDGGSINVYKNPLDCTEDPCHLAWIINQNLLGLVLNAACSNGTLLKNLDQEYFADCFVDSTIESSASTEIRAEETSPTVSSEYTSTFSTWFTSSIQYSQSPITTSTLPDVTLYDTTTDESTIIFSTISVSSEEPTVRIDTTFGATPSVSPSQLPMTTNGVEHLDLDWTIPTIAFMNFCLVLCL